MLHFEKVSKSRIPSGKHRWNCYKMKSIYKKLGNSVLFPFTETDIFCHDNSQIILQRPNPSKHTLSTASCRHRTNSTFPGFTNSSRYNLLLHHTCASTICNCLYCWMQSFNFLKSSLSLHAKKEKIFISMF